MCTMQQQQSSQSFDLYEKVTSIIIQQLEAGTIPWRKPWSTYGPPMNLMTRRHYTGINHLLLLTLPYAKPYYLTFNQVKAAGGSILPGEKGHLIIWRKLIEKEVENESEPVKRKFTTRYYFVFNVEQCKAIPEALFPIEPSDSIKKEPIAKCEWVMDGYEACPPIKHGSNLAYYHPFEDYIMMPDLSQFESSEAYYNTLFHEAIHSTGHASRLKRDEVMNHIHFGSEAYSVEELVAEIGACYLSAFCGLPFYKMENSAAYISAWLTKLKNDKKFVIKASFRAQNGADYILGVERNAQNWEALPGQNME